MESVSGVGVLDKAVAVLRAVAAGPLSLNDLAHTSGLPRATAHRLASALEDHGLVRRDGAGRFCLGLGLIGFGRSAAEGFALAEAARPVLTARRDATGEGVQLFVREADARRCVVSLQALHGLRWIVPEGALLPLAAGSAGHLLGGEPIPARGYVESVEEREPGVASVSAPVLGPAGEVVAAVCVSGPLERLTRRPGQRLGGAVVAAASELTSLALVLR